MILLTHRLRSGGSPPVVVRGKPDARRNLSILTDIVRSGAFQIARRIAETYESHLNVDRFLYVSPGAIVHPPFRELETDDWDVAAVVSSIATRPLVPIVFSGIGRIGLDAIAFRRTITTDRIVTRWVDRIESGTTPDPAVALVCAIRECGGVLLHLPETYDGTRGRPSSRLYAPVVEVLRQSDEQPALVVERPVEKPAEDHGHVGRRPECLWVGHLFQYTGYGKANREILFRVANTVTVRIHDEHKEPVYVSKDLELRLAAHKNILVGPRAPLLRLMGPDYISEKERHRIVWTMQESSRRVHADMVKRANENFDELWTPSQWNLEVFRDSGVRIPMQVMRLGVDPLTYFRRPPEPLPECRLISTSRRGLRGVPDGFTFLTIGLPGFRKGWDVLADAMELAFGGSRKVALVIGLTHAPGAWKEKVYKQFARYKVPIWTLEGSFDEHQLAKIYSSVGAYVSASLGEGFNLPAIEAGSCGTPVVVPSNTCHPELFRECLMFPTDGEKVYPEGDWISDWYKGMLFSRFGKKSIRILSGILETVREGGSTVTAAQRALTRRIRTTLTWDEAAAAATTRLLEVQP